MATSHCRNQWLRWIGFPAELLVINTCLTAGDRYWTSSTWMWIHWDIQNIRIILYLQVSYVQMQFGNLYVKYWLVQYLSLSGTVVGRKGLKSRRAREAVHRGCCCCCCCSKSIPYRSAYVTNQCQHCTLSVCFNHEAILYICKCDWERPLSVLYPRTNQSTKGSSICWIGFNLFLWKYLIIFEDLFWV